MRMRRKNRKIMISGFTLIELLAAMGIFTVIMLVLMGFFNSAQKAWTNTQRKTVMYEDARVALDLMTRDFQALMYDNDKMLFWHKDDDEVNFIAAVPDIPSAAKSNICEIRYKLDTSSNKSWLYRSLIADDSSDWDFYSSNGVGTWAEDDFHELIPYVTDFKVTCYDRTFTPITASTTETTPVPYAVKVDITVLDRENFLKWKASSNDNLRDNNKRVFSKTIIVGERYKGE